MTRLEDAEDDPFADLDPETAEIPELEARLKKIEGDNLSLLKENTTLQRALDDQKATQSDVYYHLNKRLDDNYDVISDLERLYVRGTAERERAEADFKRCIAELKAEQEAELHPLREVLLELDERVDGLKDAAEKRRDGEQARAAMQKELETSKQRHRAEVEQHQRAQLQEKQRLKREVERMVDDGTQQLTRQTEEDLQHTAASAVVTRRCLYDALLAKAAAVERALRATKRAAADNESLRAEAALADQMQAILERRGRVLDRLLLRLRRQLELRGKAATAAASSAAVVAAAGAGGNTSGGPAGETVQAAKLPAVRAAAVARTAGPAAKDAMEAAAAGAAVGMAGAGGDADEASLASEITMDSALVYPREVNRLQAAAAAAQAELKRTAEAARTAGQRAVAVAACVAAVEAAQDDDASRIFMHAFEPQGDAKMTDGAVPQHWAEELSSVLFCRGGTGGSGKPRSGGHDSSENTGDKGNRDSREENAFLVSDNVMPEHGNARAAGSANAELECRQIIKLLAELLRREGGCGDDALHTGAKAVATSAAVDHVLSSARSKTPDSTPTLHAIGASATNGTAAAATKTGAAPSSTGPSDSSSVGGGSSMSVGGLLRVSRTVADAAGSSESSHHSVGTQTAFAYVGLPAPRRWGGGRSQVSVGWGVGGSGNGGSAGVGTGKAAPPAQLVRGKGHDDLPHRATAIAT